MVASPPLSAPAGDFAARSPHPRRHPMHRSIATAEIYLACPPLPLWLVSKLRLHLFPQDPACPGPPPRLPTVTPPSSLLPRCPDSHSFSARSSSLPRTGAQRMFRAVVHGVSSSPLHSLQGRQYDGLPRFLEEDTEGQRGRVTCSCKVEALGPRSLCVDSSVQCPVLVTAGLPPPPTPGLISKGRSL